MSVSKDLAILEAHFRNEGFDEWGYDGPGHKLDVACEKCGEENLLSGNVDVVSDEGEDYGFEDTMFFCRSCGHMFFDGGPLEENEMNNVMSELPQAPQ